MCDVGCIKYFVVRCNGIIGRPMYWAVRKGAAVGMRVCFCGPKRGQSWLFGRAERRKLAAAGEKTAKSGPARATQIEERFDAGTGRQLANRGRLARLESSPT